MQRPALYAASGVNYNAKVNNAIFSKTLQRYNKFLIYANIGVLFFIFLGKNARALAYVKKFL